MTPTNISCDTYFYNRKIMTSLISGFIFMIEDSIKEMESYNQ